MKIFFWPDDAPDILHAARFCADTFPEAKFLLMIRASDLST